MKIFKRSAVIRNTLVHLLMSLGFLHIVLSISKGRSAVQVQHALETFTGQGVLLGLLALAFVFVHRVSDWAPKFFILFNAYVFFQSFQVFFITFDKTILTLNFLYIAFSFITYVLLKSELKESIYVPGYHKNGINKFSEYELSAKVEDSFGKEISGYLTNWGPAGCYFMPQENIMMRGTVQLKLNFGAKEFISLGKVMTKYGNGYGISILNKRGKKGRHPLGWEEYYDIINQRGYVPRNQ